MSGAEDLARLTVTIDTANELLLSDQIKMMDVGGGVMRPTNAKTIADLATQMYGSMIYTSVALGLAGTVDGGYFSVPSSEDDEYIVLYRNSTGAAVEVGSVPSRQAVEAIKEKIDTFNSQVVAHQFEDENRFVLMKLMASGVLELLGGEIKSEGLSFTDQSGNEVARIAAEQSDINGFVVERTDTPGIVFVGDDNFVLPGGSFTGEAQESGLSGVSLSLALDQQQRTDHMHVIGYGQSLSVGAFSLPVISTAQPYGNLMIASGTKVKANDSGYNAGSYVPLVESPLGDNGETPVTALCNGVVRRAVEIGESAASWVFLGSSPGQGGQTVEALGAGGLGYYEKMVQLVKDHAALSKSLGKTYSVWAFAWDQGEANYSPTGDGTKSDYQYAQLYLEIFDGLSREIASVTGQKFRPYLFTYQVGAHRRYASDTMQIALAQWRASRQRPDVVMAVPVYIFPTYTDLLHLTNEGSWLLGEYRSRAMFETMIRRNGKWRPLEPEAVDWNDSRIEIKFHVPSGQLVLDTALAASTPNFGFDIREAGVLVSDIISSVAVIGFDTVRISLSRPASIDSVVSYARGRNGDPAASGPVSGARGNLRDTHGLYDTAVSPLGNTFALHNPCVMFEFGRKTGF